MNAPPRTLTTDRSGPPTTAILQALLRLHSACILRHYGREPNTRGRREFDNAMTEATQVLQASRQYREEVTP